MSMHNGKGILANTFWGRHLALSWVEAKQVHSGCCTSRPAGRCSDIDQSAFGSLPMRVWGDLSWGRCTQTLCVQLDICSRWFGDLYSMPLWPCSSKSWSRPCSNASIMTRRASKGIERTQMAMCWLSGPKDALQGVSVAAMPGWLSNTPSKNSLWTTEACISQRLRSHCMNLTDHSWQNTCQWGQWI